MEGRTREEKPVECAIVKFGTKGAFELPKKTIRSHIKAEHLKVGHTRTNSPLIVVEVILNSYSIGAWMLNFPLTVSQCVELMDNLVSGTWFEHDLIEQMLCISLAARKMCYFPLDLQKLL